MQENNSAQLFDLLHISSLALPVGSYAYSQGLEQAIEAQHITNLDSASAWLSHAIVFGLGRQECVLWHQAYQAATARDPEALAAINEQIYALKETAELRLECSQMGQSMAKLLPQWEGADWLTKIDLAPIGWTYTAAHAGLAQALGLSAHAGLAGFLWAWCENQVLCLVKHMPLGQSQGQVLLQQLKPLLTQTIHAALAASPNNMGAAAVGFAINSALHETQYSRLFRS
jgi:urease accessory protein